METVDIDTPSAATPSKLKMGKRKKVLIAVAVTIGALIAGLLLIVNSSTAQEARAEVDFLTEIESTFGRPQFDGFTINDDGKATLRDAYIACAVGSDVFIKDWLAAGLPEGPGVLFLDVVESSDICSGR